MRLKLIRMAEVKQTGHTNSQQPTLKVCQRKTAVLMCERKLQHKKLEAVQVSLVRVYLTTAVSRGTPRCAWVINNVWSYVQNSIALCLCCRTEWFCWCQHKHI